MKAAVCGILTTTFWLSHATASAYSTAGTGWSRDTVSMQVDPSVEELAPGALEFLADATDAWRAAGAPDVELSVSSTPLDRDATDRQSIIAVYRDDWPFDADLLAATVRKRDPITRRLIAADVYINAHDHDWSTTGYDLHSCLVHELGHVMDLAHESDDHAAVMYRHLEQGEFKRALTDDDREGIRHLYRDRSPLGCTASDADAADVALVLVAVVAVTRRRKRQ